MYIVKEKENLLCCVFLSIFAYIILLHYMKYTSNYVYTSHIHGTDIQNVPWLSHVIT